MLFVIFITVFTVKKNAKNAEKMQTFRECHMTRPSVDSVLHNLNDRFQNFLIM
jgi:hypothetical protein